MGAFRSVLRWTFRRIIGVYFREIEVLGEAPGRGVHGRLFVSNHVNAIVDPILVLTTAPCDISPVAKSTLWKVPGFRWLLEAVDAVQITRRSDDPTKQGGSNDAVFDRVASWLQGGGNILIFPEGTSHNEPHLAPLKTGAARMLLRAAGPDSAARQGTAADSPSPDLTFQSVALEFDDREKFRSRVLVIYGPIRRAADFPGSGDPFIESVTARIRDDLSDLLVKGETWDERRLIARVAEMLANDAGDRTLAGWNAIGRQVESARRLLAADPAHFQIVQAAVNAYQTELDSLGLTDDDLVGRRPPRAASLFHKLHLLLVLPLALTGALLYAPPYWLTRLLAGRVKSHDEISTIKLGAGLVLYPLWATVLIALSLSLAPYPWNVAAVALTLLSPTGAIAWLDATPGLTRSLRSLFRRRHLEDARKARAAAMTLIKETQSKLGL